MDTAAHSRTKVLYVITKSNFGGAQRYLFDLATHLPTGRFDVAVVLGGTGERGAATGSLKQKLDASGVRTIPLMYFMRNMSLTTDIYAFFELLRVVRTERPDVLHVTSSKAGGLGALVGRLTRTRRIIFTSHGLAYDEDWRPWWHRLLIAFGTWCTIMLATTTIMITTDTYERARALPLARKRVALVHNGIDTPVFMERDDARAGLGMETRVPHILFGTIAELHRNKNLDVLVEALALLQQKGGAAELIIVGEGEEHARLTDLIRRLGMSASVHLVGYHDNAATLLRAFDVFILPSRKEGLPYVLLEAGCASLPVIASDLPGIRDIITDGTTGRLVTPTAPAIADAMRDLLAEPAHAQRLGAALNRHVHSSFSIARMVHDTITYYIP
jgi:glycosyltransferase involved in cell wall biosynthesis